MFCLGITINLPSARSQYTEYTRRKFLIHKIQLESVNVILIKCMEAGDEFSDSHSQ